MLYSLHEIALTTDTQFNNPFQDAQAAATFTSPSGKTIHVNGFYDGNNQWRIRFVPREPGTWSYTASLTACGVANLTTQQGNFNATNTPEPLIKHGYLRPSRSNPYRLEYEDQTPFYAVGLHTTGHINPDFDGPIDTSLKPKRRTISAAQWCNEFKNAVNLARIQFGQGTIHGVAQPLLPLNGPLDRYDLELAQKLDDVYKLHRNANISQILVFFQDMSAFACHSTSFGHPLDTTTYKSLNAPNLPYQEKYFRYIIARYAAFIDIWEIFNEDCCAPTDYLAHLHKIIRDADPYKHPISSNFSIYDEPFCEIIMPHEYVSIPANEVDAYLSKQIAAYKSFNKPIQYTEFGNKSGLSNVDPVKWRIVLWTAFMNEVGMLYWSQSGYQTTPKPDTYRNANAYIGPETRQHFRIFHQLTANLPQDMRPRLTHPGWIPLRSWALGNKSTTILYVHHYENHTTLYTYPPTISDGLAVETSPGTFLATWTDPSTGQEMFPPQTLTTKTRLLTVPLPPITIDAVCILKKQEPS